MYIGLHVQPFIFVRFLMALEFYRQIFEKSTNIKFN